MIFGQGIGGCARKVVTCGGVMLLCALSACRSQPEWRRRVQVLLRDPRFPRPVDKAQRCLSDDILAAGLRAAVQSVSLPEVWDYGPLYGDGCPSEQRPVCQSLVGRVGPERHPQVDLSVVAFNRASCPQAVAKATIVFDRAHPGGVIGRHDPSSLQVVNIRFRKWDEARFNSGRWTLEGEGVAAQPRIAPGTELAFDAPYPEDSLLGGGTAEDAIDFMSPWPASVFKVMVATRILALLDRGQGVEGQRIDLETPIPLPAHELVSACPQEPRTLTLRQAMETMLQWSGNCASAALVRFLHDQKEIEPSLSIDAHGYQLEPPLRSNLNAMLRSLGLTTLQMNRTSGRTGRWGNPNDNYDVRTASVANNHMTSWDTARLLWLLDADELGPAQKPRWEVEPGLPVSADFVGARQRALLRDILRDSYSGSALANNRTCVAGGASPAASAAPVPGPPPEPGIPALLSGKWVDGKRLRSPLQDYPYPQVVDDVRADADDFAYSRDLQPCQRRAEVVYMNKAGLTNVAGSSVGIVRGLAHPRRFSRHYIVSFFSSLGSRFADAARIQAVGPARDASRVTHISTTQAIPLLGQNLDAWLALWLEDD